MGAREFGWLEGAVKCNSSEFHQARIGRPPARQSSAEQRAVEMAENRDRFARSKPYDWDRVPADDAAVDAALDGLMQQVNHGNA